jgi:adenylate cyclase
MTRRRRLQVLMFLGLGAVLSALWVAAYFLDAFRDIELNTVDTRFEIRGDQKPPEDVIVVEVDAATFQDLDRRWPFPRRVHAKAVDDVAKDKPRVIAYDVQFTESTSFEDEFALLKAINRADGKVVLATTEVNDKGQSKILGGDAVLKEVGARPGNGVLLSDPGGVERRVPYEVDKLKTLAVASAEVATGRRVSDEDFDARDETAWIDYYGPPGTIKSIPFSHAVQDKTPPGFFKDKIVVIGPSAPSLQDVHPTSTSGDKLMAGAEIQASALDTVLRGLPLHDAPQWLNVLLIVAFGMLAPVAGLRLSPIPSIALAVVVGIAFTVAVQLAFNAGTIVTFVYPLGALIVATVGALAIHYVTTAFERERVRDLFGRFVPESVVGEVLEQADGARLGGVSREATVMFSDLRGFTSFAESLGPDRVITILNRYLTAMVDDAILPHGGTLVDYMGDGIMAVFGAPIQTDDHADRALAAARDKLRELTKFNEWLHTEMGIDKSFQMGIGLNSGRVMSGNVGSERRLAYTAIGDTTNTAARLEAMTKGTPYMLFLSDSTKESLSADPEDLAYVDEFEVRGREQKVKIWSVAEAERERFEGTAFESVAKPQAESAPAESSPPAPQESA